MSLENTIRKVSLSLAGLSLAASMSCGSNQQEKSYIHQPSAPAVEQTSVESPAYGKQPVSTDKPRVLKLHYHKQYSEQDIYHYFRAEYPATKNVSFSQYKRRVFQLNHALEGNMVDLLKLEDLNGNRKVGSRDYFP